MKLPTLPDLQPRERLLAIGTGIAVLVVLLDRLVLNPWLHHARNVRQDIRQMEQTLLTHQRLLTRQDQVLAELARYQRYLHPAIADDLQTAALIKEVERVAQESHVTVGEIKPLPVETDELATRYPLDVRFGCAPEEWVEFVYRIETSPLLFEVVRAGLSLNKDAPGRLDGSLRVMSSTIRSQTEPEGARHASVH